MRQFFTINIKGTVKKLLKEERLLLL